MAGVTYGANQQLGRFVYGFEGDFDWSDIKGTFTSAVLCSVSGGATCFTNLENFGTDRVRVGVDVNGWLLFGTTGVAYGQVKAGQNPCAPTAFAGNSCGEKWRSGWAVGAGVEKMFAPHWSAKLEYLHYDLASTNTYNPGVNVGVLERGDMVRAGINYNFGWPWRH